MKSYSNKNEYIIYVFNAIMYLWQGFLLRKNEGFVKMRLYSLFAVFGLSFVGMQASEQGFKEIGLNSNTVDFARVLSIQNPKDIELQHKNKLIKNKEEYLFKMHKRETRRWDLQAYLNSLSDSLADKSTNMLTLKKAMLALGVPRVNLVITLDSRFYACSKNEIITSVDPKQFTCKSWCCNTDPLENGYDYCCFKPEDPSDEDIQRYIIVVKRDLRNAIQHLEQDDLLAIERSAKIGTTFPYQQTSMIIQAQIMDRA